MLKLAKMLWSAVGCFCYLPGGEPDFSRIAFDATKTEADNWADRV
jgi:hypothetical protein